jgi:hypothetical protein
MKNLRILTLTAIILGISACININGQFRKTVYGDKHVVTKERQTESFTGIKVSTGIDVFLKQGNNESVSVEADENLQEYIITEVSGGVLNIYTEANIRSAESKKVYVTVRELKSATTTSAGDITGETPFKTDKIELEANSAGNIKLDITATEVSIDISSSGDITVSGEADKLRADLSSAGDLKAYDLKVREADVDVSSAGDADIYVTEKLSARASSAGDINYRGEPKYIDSHSSSAGGIHRR